MLKAPGYINLVLQVTSPQIDLNFLLLAEALSPYTTYYTNKGGTANICHYDFFFYASKADLPAF